jgi:hypothetical protein
MMASSGGAKRTPQNGMMKPSTIGPKKAAHQTFQNCDEAVETEHEPQTPLVVSAEGYGENRADEGDHASEGGDDLKYSP